MTSAPARKEVRRVLIITLVLNLTVAIGKIIVGSISGVLAISADGVHSLIDSASNVVGLVAVHIADKPPDEEHPYGHRRFETIAALFIGALLLLTAWEIVTGAVERLREGSTPDISPWTLGVLVVTLLVNLFVSRYERREGRRLQSELLLADAANTGADVFVTLSVLGTTLLIALFGWAWIDPLAALVIVGLIARAGWQVIRRTGSVLVDTAPFKAGELAALVREVPGVIEVNRVRSRGTPDAAHVDIDVRVARESTAERSAAIADSIRKRVREHYGGVDDVVVRFVPVAPGETDYALAARARADALGLSTHEVRVIDTPDGKTLEMHVEVPPNQTLGDAHEQVSRLEHEIRTSIPGIGAVVTHIEPEQTESVVEPAAQETESERVRARAEALLRRVYPDDDWHDMLVTPYEDGFAVSMHLTLPADTSLEAAHDRAEAAELLLRTEIDEVKRATIHTEPPEAPSDAPGDPNAA
ncbi:MAG: cation diffusion facilitator family transporter [Chloroflexota bacterium]|nr:MAG: hypothetical protein DIU68_06630 [Chloroflexota bacterium]